MLRRGSTPRIARAVGQPVVSRPEPHEQPPRYNLRPDLPDYAAFPREEWARSYRAALKRAPDLELAYGDTRGSPALRAALVSYLGRVRGVAGGPEHTFVCGGLRRRSACSARVLRRSGRTTIGVENPGHAVIREIVARNGLKPLPIRVDDEGIDVRALDRCRSGGRARDAGAPVPDRRRARRPAPGGPARAGRERRDALVIEDDYDAEFRYDRAPVAALQGPRPERVACRLGEQDAGAGARAGLAGRARRGWAAVRGESSCNDDQRAASARAAGVRGVPGGRRLDRHLRRMRVRYRERRDVLVRALERELPETRMGGIAAGLHVVVVLPAGTRSAGCWGSKGRGIALRPGSRVGLWEGFVVGLREGMVVSWRVEGLAASSRRSPRTRRGRPASRTRSPAASPRRGRRRSPSRGARGRRGSCHPRR